MKSHKAKILLAQPFMEDPNFKRSAVFVCEDDPKDGTIGFILNKPLKMRVSDLIGDFPEFDSSIFYGGPVGADTIHYVHDVGPILDESIEVSKGIYWSGNFEKLKFLIESKLVLPQNIKFFVGYSGWTPNQLNQEMKSGSWVVADMDPNYVLTNPSKSLWQKIMENKGDNYKIIAQMPDGGHLN